MKTSATIVALAGLFSAASANYFSLLAIHSGSPIHLRQVEARNSSLFIGGVTASEPAGKVASFSLSNGSLFMGASIGQAVYVYDDQISYTVPYSDAGLTGSIYNGWSSANDRVSYQSGLIACPSTNEDSYEIFADIKTQKFATTCLKLALMKGEIYTSPTADSYDN